MRCNDCTHYDVCYQYDIIGEDDNEMCALYEQKRPHGEWEKYGDKKEVYDLDGNKTWGQMRRCTNCGFIKTYVEDFGFYPFCPNCSALIWKEGEVE